MADKNFRVKNGLEIGGTEVDLAQDTTIRYDENNDRLNRPNVQSTTGNSSGFRVVAPNATTSAAATLSVFNTNDLNNGKFINISARGNPLTPLRIQTGEYVGGVLGSTGDQIDIVDGTTVYATINPAGPTNNSDLTTKSYVDAHPGTTYTIDASTATGGANFNLVGSDSTTDTVKFSGAGATTVTRTSANEITISSTDGNTTYDFNATSTTGGANLNLVGSDATTDTVKLSNGTGVTVSYVSGTEVSVAIGQPVATTDSVTFADVTANGVVVGSSANTISGTTLAIDGEAAGGGSVTLNATDSTPGGGAGQLIVDTAAFTYTHTDGALVPGVTATWTFNPSGTTSFPNYTFPYADGTANQLLKTDGSGNLSWFTPTDANTTYTIDASSTTGGANLNLVGSDSTTDTVKFASGTGVTVSQTNANEMSIAIGQAVGTGDSPSFAGVTGGNISVGVATDNTIASTNTNGDILIVPNGTGDVDLVADTVQIGDANATATLTTNGTGNLVLNTNNGTSSGSVTINQGTNGNILVSPNGTGLLVVSTAIDGDLIDDSYVLGQLRATTNTAYVFPAQSLATIQSGSGVASASSIGTGNGYSASSTFTHYYGDTRAGTNTAPAFTFQAANGVSDTSIVRPWEGTVGTAASAITANGILGSFNFGGYATTDFASYIAGMGQGGGFNVSHPLQAQGYATETFANGTLTISGATITAVSRVSAAFANVQVTGTRGQISFNATTPAVGNAVAVTGTNSGTSTGITAGTYYIIATNGSTTAQLSATPGGAPITTTAGTTTGLTFTRQFITVTYNAQTYIPFGLNAMVTISGFNNVTSGTYMAMGTSTTTSINIGAPSSGVPTLSGSQSVSCSTVTNAGSAFRIRGVPAATPLNSGNRFNFIDHSAAAATYRSDSFTFAGGAYGGTGPNYLVLNNTDSTFARPIKLSGSTSGTVQISAPAVAGTQTYTLPTAQPTANNQVLVSTTGGVMSWVSTNSLAANYLDAEWVTAIGALTANTIYGLPVASVSANNITIATGAIAIDNATATGPTRITFSQTGRYNLQFSIQLANTDSAEQDFDLWLRKNTVDVADSNTQITVVKQQGGIPGKNIMALNLLLNVTSVGDYYELVYATTSANLKPETIAAITTPYVRPRTPALLLTVVPVGA